VRRARSGGSVEIAVQGLRSPRWKQRLAEFCSAVLARVSRGPWDLSVLLCGDARMAELNSRYRGIDGPTDVLSFPRGEPGALAGDLAISIETVGRNAAAWGVSRDEELRRIVVHGILHLAGMDHGRGKGTAMARREAELARELEGERIIR
jgi:probable rRNA maturation factor